MAKINSLDKLNQEQKDLLINMIKLPINHVRGYYKGDDIYNDLLDAKNKKDKLNVKWLDLNDGIKVNINWLYPKEKRINIIDDDEDDDGEYVHLSAEEVEKYFGIVYQIISLIRSIRMFQNHKI